MARSKVTRGFGDRGGMKGVALAALMCCASTMALAENARYSDHDPNGGMRTGFVADVWLPAIESQTDIDVQEFFAGTLMGSKEVLAGVGSGVADMGFVYPGHYPNRLAAHSIFSLFPRGPQEFDDMAWFYHQVYDRVPAFKEELAKEGVVPLMVTAGLPGAFVGRNELNGIDDISGDKWRAGGKWPLKYLENAGAVPVSVPWGDVYVALQTGSIDGTFTNYDGLHLMKFDEVAQNLLISKELWFAVPFLHIANKSFVEGLSAEAATGLVEASRAAEAEFSAVYNAAFDQVRSEQEAAGYRVTELSGADVEKWENAAELENLRAEWITSAEEAGLANAAEVMEQVKAIHAEALAR
ncbi:TRAP transporter substrate-binding protein DctP [Pelagibius sp. Alg239-R121]|uniref:TRAP transporter substrate-binding protein DctP n=1 Tax=Pelagibius sp. Alg239-R121 TaxID=2993448 RepID=UPI0024A63384|nr:TRAP transporter substrate-binding protein DctP [Pelagibius sp. Alg239-R121]